MKKHIVIAGERHMGKTTLINRLMADCSVPVYGFRTKSEGCSQDGYHTIYMYPADMSDASKADANCIGACNGTERRINLNVFDELGVSLLKKAKPDGIILMDEIGFMEEDADKFCSAVLDCFKGDIPVIATAKKSHSGKLLDAVRNNPDADIYCIDEENRNELYEVLKERLKGILMLHGNNL